jgi:hypothetical protein
VARHSWQTEPRLVAASADGAWLHPVLRARILKRPPTPIAAAVENELRPFTLVRGEVLASSPGAHAEALELTEVQPGLREPLKLDPAFTVAARLDLEETEFLSRPRLETVEWGRDFYLADASGRALVRFADEHGHLHPDVDLHLDGPFLTQTTDAALGEPTRAAYLRRLRVGQVAYVCGRARRELDPTGAGSYRDAPQLAFFSADFGPLFIYDEPAFRQLRAWTALPWYRKLSLLMRNR